MSVKTEKMARLLTERLESYKIDSGKGAETYTTITPDFTGYVFRVMYDQGGGNYRVASSMVKENISLRIFRELSNRFIHTILRDLCGNNYNLTEGERRIISLFKEKRDEPKD